MGLSHVEAATQAARLTPHVTPEPAGPGHKRGQTVIDRRRGADAGLRGIPVVGVGAGAISGTKPGGELGAAARLEQAARDLNQAGRKIVRDRSQYRSS